MRTEKFISPPLPKKSDEITAKKLIEAGYKKVANPIKGINFISAFENDEIRIEINKNISFIKIYAKKDNEVCFKGIVYDFKILEHIIQAVIFFKK